LSPFLPLVRIVKILARFGRPIESTAGA
jgi:hypothetical protein